MKIQTQSDALYDTIRVVQNSIPRRSTVPVLRSIKLEARDGSLDIAGTDLEMGVEMTSDEPEIEEEGGIAVPADRFSSLLREFDGEPLRLSTDRDLLKVHTDSGSFTIVGHDIEDFPEFPEFDVDNEIEIDGTDIRDMVNATEFAVAEDMQMYALTGLYTTWAPEFIEVVGSDGNRLSRGRKRTETGLEETIHANIPPRVMSVLTKMVEDGNDVRFSGDESKVQFKTDFGRVYGRQVEGNYPNYEKAIPQNPEHNLKVNADELTSALKKVSILTSRDMPAVSFDISPDSMELKARSQEYGEGTVSIPADFDGDELQIIFNPNYLLDILKVYRDDDLTLQLTSGEEGGKIRDGQRYLHVVMPLSRESLEEDEDSEQF